MGTLQSEMVRFLSEDETKEELKDKSQEEIKRLIYGFSKPECTCPIVHAHNCNQKVKS